MDDHPPASKKSEWICEREKILLDSPFMSLIERDCRSSDDDRTHRFFVMRSRDWCNVIPITEQGNVVLVKQYRIGISAHTFEIPGGVADPSDPDIQATAIREMTEETGYVPLPGARCEALGWTFPNPAIMDNRCFSYVVGPVRREREQKLDHGEMIEVLEVPLSRIPEMIRNGEMTHALMLNTFFHLTLRSAEGPRGLRQELERFTGI